MDALHETREDTADPGQDPPPAPTRRRRRRPLRWLAAAGLLAVAAVVGAGVRLSAGPVWTEFGAGSIAAGIEEALGLPSGVDVGVVGLSLSDGLAPRLHLRDVRVDRGSEGALSVDTLVIDTTWSTLAGAESRLTAVTADHVLADVAPSDQPLPAIPEVLSGLDAVVDRTGIALVEVDSFTLRRRQPAGGPVTVFEGVGVSASAGADDTLAATLAGEGVSGGWSVTAAIEPGSGSVRRAMRLSTRGLDIADIVMMGGGAAPLANGPVSFAGRIGLAADGGIVDGSGQVLIGPVEMPSRAEGPLVAGRTRLNIAWNPAEGAIELEPSPVMLPVGHALVVGRVHPPSGGETAWRYRFAVHARDGDPRDEEHALGQAFGSYDPARRLLVLDELTASAEGATFASALRLSHEDGRIVGALSGLFPVLPVASLKAIWPAVVAPDARKWVTENVHSGTVREASVDIAFTADGLDAGTGAAADAGLTFRFEDLAFRSFDDGPMIRSAVGTGVYGGDRFEIRLERGIADLGDGRVLDLGPSTFVVPVVSKEIPDGEIRLALSGEASAAMALWRMLPLAESGAFDADPAAVAGRASAEVEIRLPLVDDLRVEDVAYAGRVTLQDVDLPPDPAGPAVRDADLSIAIADGTATITGRALVDGVPAEIDLTQPLDGGEPAASAVRMVLDAKARRTLGLDLGDALTGPVTVSLGTSAGGARRTASVDLSKAEVRVPAVGFVKPAGKAGTATFTLTTDGGRTRVDDLVVTMGSARLEGSLVLDGDGRLVSGRFPSVRFAERDDLALEIARTADGLKVTVDGRRLDGRNLVRRYIKRGDGDGGGQDGAVDLDVELGRITGFGDEDLTGVNLAARIAGGGVRALSLTAQTEGGGSASATLTPVDGGRRLQIEAGEVGRLLRFLDLYPRVFGGRATVVGTIDRNGVVRAAVDGSRWRIVEEPALARLSTAAAKGPTAGFSTAEIGRLLLDLTFHEGRLTIDDGVVRAETAGLSLQGDVDFRRDRLSLSGSYLPAGAFDSLLGKIPLLGQTVFAGGRAGLLGVSFRLTGPIDDPSLSVNPLSVIAPGIFRKLFELR